MNTPFFLIRQFSTKGTQILKVRAADIWRRSSTAALGTAAALVAIAIFALLRTRAYDDVLIDDAFITFRHAANILAGHGFTCNPGERVEGTSSMLFTFLMLIPMRLGWPPLEVARTIGALAFVGCTIVAYFGVTSVHRDNWSRLTGLGAALWVASSSILAFHSQTGMETLLYTLFITLGLVLSFRPLTHDRPAAGWAIAMGLAALCRPEGFAFFLALFALRIPFRILSTGWATKKTWRAVGFELACFGVVFLPFEIFRFFYFGELLPNSVVAKSGAMDAIGNWWWRAHLVLPTSRVGRSLIAFIQDNPMTGFVLGALLLPRARYAGMACMTIFAGAAAVYIWNGGDWMPHYRLVAPAIPALAIGVAIGIRGFLFQPDQASGKWHVTSTVFAAAILLMGIRASFQPLVPDKEPVVLAQMQKLMAELRAHRQPNDNVASDIAGTLPYYWGIPAIDACGLCNRHIARHGKRILNGIGKTDWGYLAGQTPIFYALNFPEGAVALYASREFAPLRDKYYMLRLPPPYHDYPISPPTILVRKDRPAVEQLARDLGATLVDPGEELRRTGFLRPHHIR